MPSQGSVQCCTASATLLACEYLFSVNNENRHFSRLFLYYKARLKQGRLGQHGAELSTTMQILSTAGCCYNNDWPFIPRRENTLPTYLAESKATQYVLQEYETLVDANFKQYIDLGYPVVIGMHVGRKFMKLTGSIESHDYCPVSDENRLYKGHAVTVVGYNDNLGPGSWIIANSAGPKWGDHGFAAIPYTCSKDIGEAYVIKKFAGKTVG